MRDIQHPPSAREHKEQLPSECSQLVLESCRTSSAAMPSAPPTDELTPNPRSGALSLYVDPADGPPFSVALPEEGSVFLERGVAQGGRQETPGSTPSLSLSSSFTERRIAIADRAVSARHAC